MALTRDIKGRINVSMIGTELAYVRAELKKIGSAERRRIAAALDLSVKTLNRLASKETKYGRTDTVGNLATYFRTQERRAG